MEEGHHVLAVGALTELCGRSELDRVARSVPGSARHEYGMPFGPYLPGTRVQASGPVTSIPKQREPSWPAPAKRSNVDRTVVAGSDSTWASGSIGCSTTPWPRTGRPRRARTRVGCRPLAARAVAGCEQDTGSDRANGHHERCRHRSHGSRMPVAAQARPRPSDPSLFVKGFLDPFAGALAACPSTGLGRGRGSLLVREWLLPKRRCQDVWPVTLRLVESCPDSPPGPFSSAGRRRRRGAGRRRR